MNQVPNSLPPDVNTLREQVRARLSDLRDTIRRHLAVRGGAIVAAVLLALAAGTLLIDWLGRPLWPVRATILALCGLALLYQLWRHIMRPLLLRMPDLDLAQVLDRRVPGIGQRIANLLHLPELLDAKDGTSPSMVRAALTEDAEVLDRTDLSQVLHDRRYRTWLTGIAGVALFGIAFALGWPGMAKLWAARWLAGSEQRWPQATYLSVEGLGNDKSLSVPRSEALNLLVNANPTFVNHDGHWRLTGRDEPLDILADKAPMSTSPERVSITYRSKNGSRHDGNFAQYEPGRFHFEIPQVAEPTDVWIAGGDDWLGPIHLEPVDRPTISKLRVLATTPGSQAATTYDVDQTDTQLSFLPKTSLRLELQADMELENAEVLGMESLYFKWQRESDKQYVGQWQMQDTVTLEFRLLSSHGHLISRPYYLTISRLNDRPPRVTIRATDIGRRITSVARLPLQMHATDDFGLANWSLELEAARVVDGAMKNETQTGSLPLDIDRQRTVALREFAYPPGTALRLRANARDQCVLGANTGSSRWLTFQVVTPEELFYEILMRQREQRARLAKTLVDAKAQQASLADFHSESMPALQRSHQVITRQIWQITNQLNATLQELILNDLGNEQARELLQSDIIVPLREIHDVSMPAVKKELDTMTAANIPTLDQIASAATAQDVVIEQIQKVLSAMAQWESFVDVVNQLRGVIKMQNEILDVTEKIKRQRLEGLFNDAPREGKKPDAANDKSDAQVNSPDASAAKEKAPADNPDAKPAP
jgi:hypothetical protein